MLYFTPEDTNTMCLQNNREFIINLPFQNFSLEFTDWTILVPTLNLCQVYIITKNFFISFLNQTNVVGTQKNHLNETVLLSIQNLLKLIGIKENILNFTLKKFGLTKPVYNQASHPNRDTKQEVTLTQENTGYLKATKNR